MKFAETPLKGTFVVTCEPFEDSRGLFARLFCRDSLKEINDNISIAQINYSLTIKKGSVRGLHFQYPLKSEVKMVRCLTGSVFDVIVDIRHNSQTFLKWHGETISANNMKMMYIPKGFAHGFQTLEPNCTLLYLHSESYDPSCEGALRYNDPMLGIKWPLTATLLSDKDLNHPLLTPSFSGLVI
ncbi:MAG: dTDP-4-dehydrorhamnose 3,5-epimerase [Planctomycetes bacterium]|nr:dTDP-4-dehydrorhamnose 3,5-epimerase [Planctomycetota bacterium]MBU1518013.1 dTDP-4-dehydrorhamnose 3,5-epimerase [Planctomycetota bacterium]MBU2458229.1 dTDP-4-dehydrorhamnose 3,5-epimerase [Planctomycetota bacterium]MBU2596096.1 dTDP-4-dehydrorhamnose 3,5-epimerase [Planctomycetota bacterium]